MAPIEFSVILIILRYQIIGSVNATPSRMLLQQERHGTTHQLMSKKKCSTQKPLSGGSIGEQKYFSFVVFQYQYLQLVLGWVLEWPFHDNHQHLHQQ